jgi:hypothetical protein
MTAKSQKGISIFPFFIVLDEVFQTIKTKNVSQERKALALELQGLIDITMRQWRTKLSKVFILSQDLSVSEMEGIAYQNIHIKYFGTVKSTQRQTGIFLSDELYDRQDFKHGRFLLKTDTCYEIVRTPFYGESDSFGKIPFTFRNLEVNSSE